MTLVLPYPNQPTNGNSLDATPVNSNITAITQAIQSFDASQIQAGTLPAAAFAASINPNTLLHDTISPFVSSGCVWSSVSGLSGTMTSGVIYVGNSTSTFRTTIGGVGSFTFTASKDTYIDIDYNGNITYNAVANGAAAPALTANSIRVAKVVTSGAAITSIVQSGLDSLNNPIKPAGSISPSVIDWNSFGLNMKSATNGSSVSLGNVSTDLGPNGLSLSFTVAYACNALVTVSLGVSSTSDFEFRPEIRLGGNVYFTFTPAAAAGNASSRASVRGFTYVLPLVAGTNVISAGVTLTSSTAASLAINGGTIAALVLGKVTA